MFKAGAKVRRTHPADGSLLVREGSVHVVDSVLASGMIRLEGAAGEWDPLRFEAVPRAAAALDVQVGGNHYKDLKIQPVEYIMANNIPYMEGNVIKYVSRWRNKGGIPDLEKAKHYLEMLIEQEKKAQ